MNIRELEKRLRDKERELLADIARTESEARESRVAEVEDPADGSISSESKESLLQQTTFDWNVFTPSPRRLTADREWRIWEMCRLRPPD